MVSLTITPSNADDAANQKPDPRKKTAFISSHFKGHTLSFTHVSRRPLSSDPL